MTFTENDKLKALVIVHVFETSKPLGDYVACVALNDDAVDRLEPFARPPVLGGGKPVGELVADFALQRPGSS